MEKSHILPRPLVMFLIAPYQGHLNATLSVAAIYRGKASIVFVGPQQLKAQVEAQGWQYQVLEIQYFKTPVNAMRFWKAIATVLTPRQQRSEFFAECNELRSIVHLFQPDMVFMDAFLTVFYPVIKHTGISCATIQTTLPTQKSNDVPPLTSGYIPDSTWSSQIKIRLHWRKRLFYNWVTNLLIRILSVNRFHVDLMKSLKGYTANDYCFKTLMVPTINTIPEIVTTTSAFDFHCYQKRPNQVFTGLSIYPREENVSNELAAFIEYAKHHNGKIIYCSFGTVLPAQGPMISALLHKLSKLATEEQKWFFILKSGEIKNHQPNVFTSNSLPQLFVLEHSDLMISHGGLNSINECISSEVPMLIYPVDQNSDRPGNAARICYHNIGLRGNIQRDTEEALHSKIKELLENETVLNNLRTMKLEAGHEASNFQLFASTILASACKPDDVLQPAFEIQSRSTINLTH